MGAFDPALDSHFKTQGWAKRGKGLEACRIVEASSAWQALRALAMFCIGMLLVKGRPKGLLVMDGMEQMIRVVCHIDSEYCSALLCKWIIQNIQRVALAISVVAMRG